MDGWPPHCWRYPRQNVALLPPYLDTSPIPDRLLILAARATTKCLKAFKSGEVRCPLTILEVCLSIWDVSNYALSFLRCAEMKYGRRVCTTRAWITCTDELNMCAYNIASKSLIERYPHLTLPNRDRYMALARQLTNALWRNNTIDDPPITEWKVLEKLLSWSLPPPCELPFNRRLYLDPGSNVEERKSKSKPSSVVKRLHSLTSKLKILGPLPLGSFRHKHAAVG